MKGLGGVQLHLYSFRVAWFYPTYSRDGRVICLNEDFHGFPHSTSIKPSRFFPISSVILQSMEDTWNCLTVSCGGLLLWGTSTKDCNSFQAAPPHFPLASSAYMPRQQFSCLVDWTSRTNSACANFQSYIVWIVLCVGPKGKWRLSKEEHLENGSEKRRYFCLCCSQLRQGKCAVCLAGCRSVDNVLGSVLKSDG